MALQMRLLPVPSQNNRWLLLFGRAETNSIVVLSNKREGGFFREASGLLLFEGRVGDEDTSSSCAVNTDASRKGSGRYADLHESSDLKL